MTPDQPMEQYVRVMVAVMLCVVVMWAYQAFFLPAPTPQKRTAATSDTQKVVPKDQEGTPASPKKPIDTEQAPVVVIDVDEDVSELSFELDTNQFDMSWTNVGAALEWMELTNYFKTTAEKEQLILVPEVEDGVRSLVLHAISPGDDEERPPGLLDLSDLAERRWKVLEQGPDRIVFQIATRDGKLIVTKRITLPAGDAHHFLIQLDFQSASTEEVKFHYLFRGAAGIVQEDVGYGSEPVGLIATTEEDDLSEVAIGKVPKGEPRIDSREIAFTGIQNKYFSMLLVPIQPPGPVFASIASLEQSELLRPYEDKWQFMPPDQEQKFKQQARNNLAASLGVEEVRLEQGAKVTHTYLFFAGPKDKELLESYAAAPEGLEGYSNPHFERILHRGWVGGISRFFVAVLTWIHSHIIANWGVSVIILTFLVRACLHPLNRKSQKSLHGMSKLKPEMDAIKKKYEGRKSKEQSAKMQREILGLYREHHVNPAGGCLPMFVQLPIFFGLYRAFGQAVDLRQADFMLWINDLSREDCLLELSFAIPLIGSRCFNILPILVILTWFIQQKMQPKAADPQMAQQQKIMSYMLIFMGFFFYKIPSGLNLYFLTSGILGMFENRWIKKQLEALPEPVKKPSPSKKKGKKNRRP